MFKKAMVLAFLLVFSLFTAYAVDLKVVDDLNHNGKYEEAVKMLMDGFSAASPDAAIIWRVGRDTFEIAEKIPMKSKKEKIAKYEEAMVFLMKYFDLKEGDKTDRAKIIYYYAVNLGQRGKTVGIKESLNIVPDLYFYGFRSLEIDPAFSGPYVLLAKIDEALAPFGIFGGDYYRMGINFTKAIESEPKEMTAIVDGAIAFYDRNWSVDKKKKETESWNSRKNSIRAKTADTKKMKPGDVKRLLAEYEWSAVTDGTPANLSDREHAWKILELAKDVYSKIKNPSARDTGKYNEGMALMKKFK